MNYEIVRLEEKTVAGISARTNNLDPQMGIVIGGLWERFFGEGVYASIHGKVNKKALGIYTDYAGDEKNDYTVMTACEVEEDAGEASRKAESTEGSVSDAPYSVRKIPAGRYARFIVKGDMRTAVAQCWQEIWKLSLPRAFVCDFEEYQDDRMEDAEIHIYIGLREEETEAAPCGVL